MTEHKCKICNDVGYNDSWIEDHAKITKHDDYQSITTIDLSNIKTKNTQTSFKKLKKENIYLSELSVPFDENLEDYFQIDISSQNPLLRAQLEKQILENQKIVERVEKRLQQLDNEKIIRGTFDYEDSVDITGDIQDELQSILKGSSS